jgi:hypothetical protein
MNIFVTDECPEKSAIVLPDRHIVKMPIECAQMLAYVIQYHNMGTLPKKDGSPYSTESIARRNHPCTQWALKNSQNALWLIHHGRALCTEYTFRYNKIHGSARAIETALIKFDQLSIILNKQLIFTRAMPDELKNDTSIPTFDAYKKYLNSKDWVSTNYLRVPERKPNWIE